MWESNFPQPAKKKSKQVCNFRHVNRGARKRRSTAMPWQKSLSRFSAALDPGRKRKRKHLGTFFFSFPFFAGPPRWMSAEYATTRLSSQTELRRFPSSSPKFLCFLGRIRSPLACKVMPRVFASLAATECAAHFCPSNDAPPLPIYLPRYLCSSSWSTNLVGPLTCVTAPSLRGRFAQGATMHSVDSNEM
ncbi:uncharacterized protein IWZ02DRAFT_124584 [Phyllosticta citriasiana]|uniref:uncharacterized protein n=1 Tax=Phyllosticta citriasiana TaxID=595635 RepID=UPI0030FDD6A4